MWKAVASVGCMALMLGLAGCGGSEESRSDNLGNSDWTLTIISPDHGSQVPPAAQVEVALTGPAAARGETPDFDVGFFIDDQLVMQGGDLAVELNLPLGSHTLRVSAVDVSGIPLPDVVGDVIDINVTPVAGQAPFTVPANFGNVEVRLGGSVIPVGNVSTPPIETVPPNLSNVRVPTVTPPTGG